MAAKRPENLLLRMNKNNNSVASDWILGLATQVFSSQATTPLAALTERSVVFRRFRAFRGNAFVF